MLPVCKIGKLTHDQWVEAATGGRLSSEPLLEATHSAL